MKKREFYSSYPVYHSVYETFELVQNFYDPSFERLRAVAQVRGGLVFRLADSLVLPLDANEYATALGKYAHSIAQVAQRHPEEMKKYQVSFGEITLYTVHFLCHHLPEASGGNPFPLNVLAFLREFRCFVFCCGKLYHGFQGLSRETGDPQQSRVRLLC